MALKMHMFSATGSVTVTLHGKDFVDVIKRKRERLSWIIWVSPNVITIVLMRESEEAYTETEEMNAI